MAKASDNNKIVLMDEQNLRNKIYLIRESRVMLDTDLAEIYGYTTRAFNQQVKNNIEKFPDDFRFQLTKDEVEDLRSKFLTANISSKSRSAPYAFTESGVYMLMSILRGELATRQSITLIRLFKGMKDYLNENQPLFSQKSYATLIETVEKHNTDIHEIKKNMVTRADLSGFTELFDEGMRSEETLICEGQLLKADLVYQEIYKKAKNNIIVIDDYIGVKTLYHIAHAKTSVARTIITDNRGANPLRKTEYEDYLTEYPGKEIRFLKTNNKTHDRFIVADYGTKNVRAYLCGSSSKDSGKRVTMIMEMKDPENIKDTVERFIHNPELKLK